MAATKREKMSAVDTAWLRMDRPQNLMMICGVLMFGETDRRSRACARSSPSASWCSGASASAPVETPGDAFWEDDAALRHRRVTSSARRCRAAPAERELQALVSRLASTPLDPARPMWQFHLVDNYEGGSALIARIHHCYADGIALVRVMLSMTDADRERPAGDAVRAAPRASGTRRRRSAGAVAGAVVGRA